MPDQVLSRTQRNNIFEIIRGAGLDPADFEWSTIPDSDIGPKDVITHPPTGGVCEFTHYRDDFWLDWWPSRGKGRMLQSASVWQDAIVYLVDWIAAIKEDHCAPDLWGEIAKEKTISAASVGHQYAQPFSPAELKQLESSLVDIEHYIATTQPLDPAQKTTLHLRFEYLLDAAKNTPRKVDWLNIFVAQMITLVTTGLLDPSVYGRVMAHAATALNAIFQFGLKLLG